MILQANITRPINFTKQIWQISFVVVFFFHFYGIDFFNKTTPAKKLCPCEQGRTEWISCCWWICLPRYYKGKKNQILPNLIIRGAMSEPCDQRTLKSTCGSAQSDQQPCCPHKETLHPWLSKMRPVKILISLRKCCAGWSESLLGAQVRRYVYWRGVS